MVDKLVGGARRRIALVVALICAAGVLAVPRLDAHAATPFKVLAFYSGTYDAAHIDFDKEANVWFPQIATRYGFSWESTTDWNRLNAITPGRTRTTRWSTRTSGTTR